MPEQQLKDARRYEDAGEVDRATDCYRQALAQRPDHVAARVALGRVLLRQDDAAGARQQLFLALQHDPDQMVARRLLVDANLTLSNTLEAHRWLSEYLRVLPADDEAQRLFADIEAQLGVEQGSDTQKAVSLLPKTVQLREPASVVTEREAADPNERQQSEADKLSETDLGTVGGALKPLPMNQQHSIRSDETRDNPSSAARGDNVLIGLPERQVSSASVRETERRLLVLRHLRSWSATLDRIVATGIG